MALDLVKKLIPTFTVGAAQTLVGPETMLPREARTVSVEALFLYGAGGTTCKAFLQTSMDGGATWCDIACFAFTTAAATKVASVTAMVASAAPAALTDGTLTDNTLANGILGDRIRLKMISTGTYTGATSLTVSAVIH